MHLQKFKEILRLMAMGCEMGRPVCVRPDACPTCSAGGGGGDIKRAIKRVREKSMGCNQRKEYIKQGSHQVISNAAPLSD